MMLGSQKDSSVAMDLCSCFFYQYSPGSRVIFREGDTENTNFYFVLEGSVGVYIPSLAKGTNKKELSDLENPGWSPNNCDDRKMAEKEQACALRGFLPEDICVYLPKCIFFFFICIGEILLGRINL